VRGVIELRGEGGGDEAVHGDVLAGGEVAGLAGAQPPSNQSVRPSPLSLCLPLKTAGSRKYCHGFVPASACAVWVASAGSGRKREGSVTFMAQGGRRAVEWS
jgi:hypothetical protein